VCCVYHRIDTPELKKEPMHHCPHVIADEVEIPGQSVCYSGEGCSIYKNRFPVCVGYQCAWIKGHGAEEDRPDRCGVLFDNVRRVENSIECKPIWDGATETEAGKKAIERVSESMGVPALVISFYERELVRVVGRAWR
jgi:hypothetical protein